MHQQGQTDIRNRADIEAILIDFYGRAFEDPLLGPIFVDVAQLDLAAHLPVIADFWESVIFRTGAYRGGAFEVHRALNDKVPLGEREFDRWVELWTSTVSDHHSGELASAAILSGQRFANAFQRRLKGESVGSNVTLEARGSG